jgi:hypothetical protein
VRLRFYWDDPGFRIEPSCEVADAGPHPEDLAGLLTNDGGCGNDHLLRFMKHGREQCEAVRRGEVASVDFDGEVWCSRLAADGVEIAYDESLIGTSEVFRCPLDTFARVLDDWIAFLEATIHSPERLTIERVHEYA